MRAGGGCAHAARVASELLGQFGFDPVNPGALADRWRCTRAKPVCRIALDRACLVEVAITLHYKAAKQQSSKAAKQQSSKAAKQQSSKAAKQQSGTYLRGI
ncbi:hypothetical protein [Paraburkholderia ribeironis]|uniref:hypothetical protein n=1 Tax=Paraburkholderia ribeironis TaxID=1247936 RepID=UPI00157C79A4|nr:hypothetical protein [Paraburkholderia ribeironis]